jgi:hypothetical protein
MGALGASGFIFRDFIKYILPTLTGACLLLPMFVEWKLIKIDQIIFLSFLSGYIIYPLVSLVANFVHDRLPCVGGISLSPKSPAVEESRWVKSNWDMKALRSKIDKDEREYLYLTQSYSEYFQITGFYFLLFSVFNFIRIFASSPDSLLAAFNSCKLFEYIQSVSIGTIVGSSVPSIYAGLFGLVISFLLFQASVIEYKALFGINGAYEFFLEKYQSSKGGLARSIWGRVHLETESRCLKLKLLRNNKHIDTCIVDELGRFQFSDRFNECINYRCKIVVATPGFAGESEMSITKNCIPCLNVVVMQSQ